jgi:UDP-2-acetamido-3-amino-2,3-dideoxy-glucuronate N-acetyltransferase
MARRRSIAQLIELPLRRDERGDLVFAETKKHLPFPIRRVFFIYNVRTGGNRGHHAHKKTRLALICLQGSTRILLDDGKVKDEVTLTKPEQALLIPPKIWHSMNRFKKGTVILALASEPYNEDDYLRDYQAFKEYIRN